MTGADGLPEKKQKLVQEILQELIVVRRVAAVGLGGSWARGTAHPDSDLDLGLYYSESAPFEVAQYPPALKKSIVRESLWGTEFTLSFARRLEVLFESVVGLVGTQYKPKYRL